MYNPDYNLGEVVLEEPNTMESMQTHFENIMNTITDMLNIKNCILALVIGITLGLILKLLIDFVYGMLTPEKEEQEEENIVQVLQNGGEPLPRCTLYYANWCGHCKNFKPTWEELKKSDKYENVVDFEDVEGDEQPEVIQQEDIQGFPTIKLKTKSDTVEYNGDRTIEDLKRFLDENL
tara:strand:+ start:596 stop:1129 length:534 start_codon:yes stop_codon:yes gene_type:complete